MNLRFFFNQYQFWGKVIGAIFGFLIGGPAGAVLGIFVGNFFDKGLIQHLNRPYWDLYTQRQSPIYQTFLNTTFQVMGYIAKADGRVPEKSIHFAKHAMEEMRLNQEQIELAKTNFQLGKSPQFDLSLTLMSFKQAMYSHPNLIMTFLSIQYQHALHLGLSFSRIQVLNQVFQYLGYAPIQQQYHYYEDAPHSSYSSRSSDPPPSSPKYHTLTLAEAFHILNIDTQATKSVVKQAYRRLMSKNHPDKLMAQGKSEAEIKYANDKTQKIRQAYEYICAAKGW